MGNTGKNKNPLQRNGTSQDERLLAALKSDYVKVDERGYADCITFANHFGEHLNFFDETGKITSDWSSFFTQDISSVLASIAVQDIGEYKYQIKSRLDFLRDDDHRLETHALKRRLNELFSAVFTLSKALDNYYYRLSPELSLKTGLLNLISTKLSQPLKRFIGYYKAAKNNNNLLPLQNTDWKILNSNLTEANQIVAIDGLSKNWFPTSFATWNDYVNSIAVDESIFNSPLSSNVYAKIEHAANHNLFSGIFDQYLFVYTKVVKDAFRELEKTLEAYDNHAPHYALFLAFLKLFSHSRDHANTLTGRHLDFYYKEVLQLKPKAAQANFVHVLIELAKQKEEYALPAGTLFKAGKDSSGKEVVYTLDEETVFNKAKVASLKAVYRGSSTDSVLDPLTAATLELNTGRLFAAPVVNSADGDGAEIKSTQKEWHPFVNREYEEGTLKEIAMPKAEIGFAVASHYLFLSEGERVIYVRLKTQPVNLPEALQIECYLTTEKEWLKVDAEVQSSGENALSDGSAPFTQIVITLSADAPAIVNYNQTVHGGLFGSELPILKVYLPQEADQTYPYKNLQNLTLEKVEIKVEVGAQTGYTQTGLKNLLVSNDFGPLDPSKPFMPFGPQPSKGSRLIIGSKEVFSKKNAALNLHLEWKDLPESMYDISFNTLSDGIFPNIFKKRLLTGKWEEISQGELFANTGIAVQPTKVVSFTESDLQNTSIAYENEYASYSISSNKGFISLQLSQEPGHKEYLAALTDYLIRQALKELGENEEPPAEPYTPTLQSVYLSYSAYTLNDLTRSEEEDYFQQEIYFYTIYPFGEVEQHKFLRKSDVKLLPQFNHKILGTTTIPHQGEFYIGVENLEAGQGVNILFQLLEGSSDPLAPKLEDHIHWSYLSSNQWISFEASAIQDATLDLVQSGIISFTIPEDATSDNTLLPPGMIWIRASVGCLPDKACKPEAVCKLISVDAQAAKLTFLPNDNAEDFLDTALPPELINKLKTPDAAVKKVLQPYSSFGGRPKEGSEKFYVRVSERLRHKERAVTIWDYERLVLEAFPEIYKVKCLNHTGIELKEELEVMNEVKPGNVLMITIPQLGYLNDADPLKPYTSQNILSNIEKFLDERVSCHVTVRAVQPQFEEVRLKFKLKLREEYQDFTFYSKRLQESIMQFLTPWAFSGVANINFGGQVYKSSVINFIEEQEYVDYITDVELFVKPQENGPESHDQEIVTASTARSILVSVPASRHEIAPV